MALTKISRSLLDTGISDSSDATAITIDSNENVGIGTSTIDTTYSGYVGLELGAQAVINGNRTTSDTGVTSISQNGYLSSASGGSWKYKEAGKASLMQQIDDGTIRFSTTDTTGSADDALTWSERMRIDSSGNVVIGGTTAYGRLNLHGTGSTTASLTGIQESSFTSYDDNGGTAGSISGFFNFKATTGIGGGMGIIRESSGDWGTAVAFYNHPSTTSNIGDLTERMRINSSGSVLLGDGANEDITYTAANKLIMHHGHAFGNIGISLSCGAYTTSYELMRFYNGNGQVGDIAVSGSATDFDTNSDYRLKENVTYDWDATTRLKQLKPARFNWIADETNTLLDGFLAHEVSDIVPNAINGEKDAVYTAQDEANGLGKEGEPNMQGIDHSKLVPLLVKTIQELEARITTLEGE